MYVENLFGLKIDFRNLNIKFSISEMSEELLQYFVNPTILQHTGGHFIPASSPQKKVYLEFFKAMIARKAGS
jgi:hypothetical protein